MVLHANALPSLLALLQPENRKPIRKEACWTISNIMAGSADQIQAVIDNNIVQSIVHILRSAEWDVRKEACWAISNATSGGNPQQIQYLVQHAQVIAPLCDMLRETQDYRLCLVALEGLENILRSGKQVAGPMMNPYVNYALEAGLPDILEMLQENAPGNVYEKCVTMITEYFQGVEENQELHDQQQDNQDYGQVQWGEPNQVQNYNQGMDDEEGEQQNFNFNFQQNGGSATAGMNQQQGMQPPGPPNSGNFNFNQFH